ncbi:MAG: hypothetical protein P0Y49_05035 [Candidatus Pedobacter colombiensis]|uniref:DUF6705 domain-containing protein n=1 Tax=Candidatus Pedobacter colombiensis TaxID=3121371 RepID=A0AAJ5WBD9_9SPHI|nr:DUF6705 family protein [Pedobacter sp.]WEK20500.1 MAG: hypothetical protein P0Y49_05035 [Pedobacter sp.]
MKKNLIILGILFLIFSSVRAQVSNISDPLNDLDVAQMDKFIGKWEWKSKNTSFTLIIKKTKQGIIPLLQGGYQYVENGSVIINLLDHLDEAKKSVFWGYAKKGNDTLKFSFSDPTREELRHGTLNFIKGDSNKIIFKLKNEKNRHSLKLLFASKQRQVFKGKFPDDLNLVMTRVE